MNNTEVVDVPEANKGVFPLHLMMRFYISSPAALNSTVVVTEI
jgi:hypothetical protein